MNILVKYGYSVTSIFLVDESGTHKLCQLSAGPASDKPERILVQALTRYFSCGVHYDDRR